ncbi:hypothetical protein H6G17_29535 [Chroococcidiopsis sp. FACHB-1243]|nr:hypothetical protein [Chroococcidiopsis sp. [FACHB-1243]]
MSLLFLPATAALSAPSVVSAHFALPAAADSTADLIVTLKCPNDYTVNVWKRYGSGKLLFRGIGLLGNLSLGKGTNDSTGAAQVYKFKHGNYEYQVLGRRRDHQAQGSLTVYKNGRSIFSQACTREE